MKLSGMRALAAGCLAIALAGAASGQVVISQVWGGGGFIGDGPNADTVELFNAGAAPVNLTGLSLQWRSGTSTAAVSATTGVVALSGTIQPKKYFLVRLENPSGTGFATATPDLTFTRIDPISVNRGQLFLVAGTTNLGAGCPAALNGNTAIVDFVGYGRGLNNDLSDCPGTFCAVCCEGVAPTDNAPGGQSTGANAIWIRRKCGGLLDTNNNNSDWERTGPGVGVSSPFRNSASPANTSGVVITPGPSNFAAFPGDPIGLSAQVASNCGSVSSVTVNLTQIGGGASVPMNFVSTGNYALSSSIGVGVTPGSKTITFTATNNLGQSSSNTLDIVVRVGNDECAGSVLLSGPGPYSWSNIGGTTGTDGQTFAGCDNGATMGGAIRQDVWYRWTAPSTGEFTISTVGSVGAVQPDNRFDARIAVYDFACPPGTPIACNDDAPLPDGPASRTKFAATGGSTYLIQVGADALATFTSQGVLTITAGAPGACCFGDAQCTQVASQADCANVSGTFRGSGSVCANELCPGLPGACCFFDTVFMQDTCQVTDRFFCTNVFLGTFGVGLTCSPTPCPLASNGVCCRGATCQANVDQASCTGANTVFVSTTTTCNASGNNLTPCCKADFNKVGGITVQDIFDFLNAWFSGNALADITNNGAGAPTVQSIFDFLTAWFSGGC